MTDERYNDGDKGWLTRTAREDPAEAPVVPPRDGTGRSVTGRRRLDNRGNPPAANEHPDVDAVRAYDRHTAGCERWDRPVMLSVVVPARLVEALRLMVREGDTDVIDLFLTQEQAVSLSGELRRAVEVSDPHVGPGVEAFDDLFEDHDAIHVNTIVAVGWRDRLRVLLVGRFKIWTTVETTLPVIGPTRAKVEVTAYRVRRALMRLVPRRYRIDTNATMSAPAAKDTGP